MATATINLTLTVTTDSEGEVLSDALIEHVIDVQGVHPNSVPPVLISVAEGLMLTLLMSELRTANPTANDDMLASMATLNGRLRMLDEMMHLPYPDPRGGVLPLT